MSARRGLREPRALTSGEVLELYSECGGSGFGAASDWHRAVTVGRRLDVRIEAVLGYQWMQ